MVSPINSCPPGISECDLIWKQGPGRCKKGRDRNEITVNYGGSLIMRASTKKRGKGHTQTHPRRGHVTTEAENGEMQPQVKEHEERPETGRGREDLPLEPSEGAGPANTLFSDF